MRFDGSAPYLARFGVARFAGTVPLNTEIDE